MEHRSDWQVDFSGQNEGMSVDESGPALRADARRNREQVLAVACAMMAEDGVDLSLRSVARRSGVGIGTLYRHFPTREALISAALGDRIQCLAVFAEESLDTDSPGAALIVWLQRMTRGAAKFQGLSGWMLNGLADEASPLYDACRQLVGAGAKLLAQAQDAGEIRTDVSIKDLFAVSSAISWTTQTSGPERAEQMLTVMIDGLQVSPA